MRKKFTIIGNPVAHSVSPDLFKAAYPGLLHGTYDRSLVYSAQEGIALLQTSYTGANITAPFKEDSLKLVDMLSDEAKAIGAINEVVCLANGRLRGHNTDYLGVMGSFNEFKIDLQGKKCIVLGLGGAAKAAIFGLIQMKADVIIVNRTMTTATQFAQQMGCTAAPIEQLVEHLSDTVVLVNTLYPDIDLIEQQNLRPKQIVLDASYIGSVLLNKARKQKCCCIDGRYWLLHQAIPAFIDFTGEKPDVQAMRNTLGL